MSLSLPSDHQSIVSAVDSKPWSVRMSGVPWRYVYLAIWIVNALSLAWLTWLDYATPSFVANGRFRVEALRDHLVITGMALTTGASLLCMSWFGSRQARSLLAVFGIISLSCVWLATTSYWPAIARLGKQHRLRHDLSAFEMVAMSLRKDWPKTDGNNPILGAYMAYPVGQPSILIMLTLPEIEGIDASVIAVERGLEGQLRFQLAGRERGDWLEWHPHGSYPASFLGGIFELYELERYDQIAEHWFLVSYRTPLPKTALRTSRMH